MRLSASTDSMHMCPFDPVWDCLKQRAGIWTCKHISAPVSCVSLIVPQPTILSLIHRDTPGNGLCFLICLFLKATHQGYRAFKYMTQPNSLACFRSISNRLSSEAQDEAGIAFDGGIV